MISIGKSGQRTLAAIAFVCAFGVAAVAQAGEFRIRGTGIGGGNAYEGRVATEIIGNTIKVIWVVGGSRYTGNGVIDGDSLAVYFTGPSTGVALYRFDRATGAFHGKWTTAGANNVGTEDWFPIK